MTRDAGHERTERAEERVGFDRTGDRERVQQIARRARADAVELGYAQEEPAPRPRIQGAAPP